MCVLILCGKIGKNNISIYNHKCNAVSYRFAKVDLVSILYVSIVESCQSWTFDIRTQTKLNGSPSSRFITIWQSHLTPINLLNCECVRVWESSSVWVDVYVYIYCSVSMPAIFQHCWFSMAAYFLLSLTFSVGVDGGSGIWIVTVWPKWREWNQQKNQIKYIKEKNNNHSHCCIAKLGNLLASIQFFLLVIWKEEADAERERKRLASIFISSCFQHTNFSHCCYNTRCCSLFFSHTHTSIYQTLLMLVLFSICECHCWQYSMQYTVTYTYVSILNVAIRNFCY